MLEKLTDLDVLNIKNPLLNEQKELSLFHPVSSKLQKEEFLSKVENSKIFLEKKNISNGDSLAVYSLNSVNLIALILACFDLGIRLSMLNRRSSNKELLQCLKQCSAKALVIDDSSLEFNPIYSFKEIHENNRDVKYKEANWTLDREALVIFTSGSQGKPKGVVHTLRSLLFSAYSSNKATGYNKDSSWLLSLPLYHLGGFQILSRALVASAKIVLLKEHDTKSIAQELKKTRVNYASFVPTQVQELINEVGIGFIEKSIDNILLAGAPSSPDLLATLKKSSLNMIPCYGATETAGHCTALKAPYNKNKISTVGSPLEGVEIKLEPGGEIIISGLQNAKGYLDENAILIPFLKWYSTGDMGSFDYEGDLTILGRLDDIIISGGENISCKEIEFTVINSKLVKNAAVIGVSDSKWGERPILFVELINSEDEDWLKKYIDANLSKLKKPDRTIFLKLMPKTAIGKTDYKKLRESL